MRLFKMVGAWDPVSAWLYESCVAERLGTLYDRFVAAVATEVAAGSTIVDVGCGEGQVSRRLAERHPEATVIGIDLSPTMVERAAARHGHLGNLGFRVGDALELPFSTGTADLVVSVASIKHWPDRLAGVKEILRVLAPGGFLCLLEADRDCSPAASRRFASYWRPSLPPTPIVGGAYFRRFVAGQALNLDELVGLLTRAGVVGLEARRLDELPFVVAQARKPA